ncbi:Cytochrome c heme lyase subunit CcmF [Thioalkalivibrio nitratireducens DSM 14787]|uniref:Cytochrome c heme lyase subunit CcmF n=1 Tax=Thioalkalivibrio nitratireducens (strain DSM 14787 / UNIQEM 213 / ALEN2) TaxID=1255043 RepID=L0DXB4_THIND|nr:Cytochrome c heme lyase subunit CcmF [Thioalkalivibrio nitratireducens DSM 14787]
MNWIWTGAVLMGLGGFLAATDRRYRVRVRREEDLPDDDTDTAARPSTAATG